MSLSGSIFDFRSSMFNFTIKLLAFVRHALKQSVKKIQQHKIISNFHSPRIESKKNCAKLFDFGNILVVFVKHINKYRFLQL